MHLPSHIPSHSNWRIGERAPPDAIAKFTWVFPMRNKEWLKNKFDEVSDPHNSNYQHYLTREEINEMTHSDPALVQPVVDWFRANGISQSEIELNSENAIVQSKVSNIEKLFHTKLYSCHKYNDSGTLLEQSGTIYRTPHGVEIPDELKQSLDLLLGLIDMPAIIHHGPIMRPVRPPIRQIIIDDPAPASNQSDSSSSQPSIHPDQQPTSQPGSRRGGDSIPIHVVHSNDQSSNQSQHQPIHKGE